MSEEWKGDARRWIEVLGLRKHPEGGYYRETYRSSERVRSDRKELERSASTAIYFLITTLAPSRFHRLRSDEVWHFHAGAPLRLHLLDPERGEREELSLGLEPEREVMPQQVVPGGVWFAAEVKGEGGYSLVSCTVAPGFEFVDFEMATRQELLEIFPEEEALIAMLGPRTDEQ